MTITLLIAGLFLLLAGGTGLVKGASAIASHYGVSPLVVGLTVVAFGSSAPELVVNVVGAIRDETELAFGNVTGSNLANIGLVLATATIFRPITIQGQLVRRELPLLLLGTTVLLVVAMDKPLTNMDALLTRSDGLVLLLIFTIFIYITVSDFLDSKAQDALVINITEMEGMLPAPKATTVRSNWIIVVAGILALTAGGQLTIIHGAQLAASMGMQPVIVGMVIVAIGTSLPEFVTSIIAAIKRESDLCLGNVVGSNIFNGLVVLPIAALVRPLPIPEGGLIDVTMSLLFAAIIILVFFFGKGHMSRKVGAGLLLVYLAYMTIRMSA